MADPERPLVEVSGLSFKYDGAAETVLRDLDLQIAAGEVVLLLGPSGAGKSTLALAFNGLIPHQLDGKMSGRVLVDGLDTQTNRVADLCQRVGLVFQDPEAQIALLTIGDEVAFSLENLRLPPAEMPGRIANALELVGLVGMEEQATDALSGGQKQRLALAAALALEPRLLVFDEPTANLDPATARAFFQLCQQLKATGATILIIEHRLDDLIGLVDRVAVLSPEGSIAASGPPHDVLTNPTYQQQLADYGVWLPQVAEACLPLVTRSLRLPLTVADAVPLVVEVGMQFIVPGSSTDLSTEGQSVIYHAPTEILRVRNLRYRYPGAVDEALRGVDVAVGAGEFLAIVGPNGSGKSTLAAHLFGLLKPPVGAVTIAGQDVGKLKGSALAQLIGYVFQNPEHQFVTRTVRDEVAFGLRGQGLDEAIIQQRVDEVLDEFGLLQYAGRNPFSLSQGQKRRLSVATMLGVAPKLLVLDEPTFGQDRSNADRLMARLRAINQQGTTILMITHDMTLVAEHADRVAVMLQGQIAFSSSPHDLFADTELMQAASLLPPPLFDLSQQVRQQVPDFPLLTTVKQYHTLLNHNVSVQSTLTNLSQRGRL